MTRMYLSPLATIFVKIGLSFVECLIGFYNLITMPIRKITAKAYIYVLLVFGIFYTAMFYNDFTKHIVAFVVIWGLFTVSIFTTKCVYNILKKKVSPRVARLINSPLGIPLNRFYA